MSSIDGGASWKPEAAARAPAIMGRTIDKLGPAGSALIDARRAVVVELLNESMWLESRSDDALVAGANLAVLGSELVQFGRVEPLGNSQFRLTRLLRGRRGSEPAAMEHHAGEPFLLLDASTVTVIEPVSGSVGGNLWVSAQGIGDGDQPVLVKTPIEAQALMPPSPVHLRAERSLDGGVTIRWTRRSRNGWAWLSGSEAPLGEESEAYRLVLRGEGFERVISVESPVYVYTAGQQAEDGFSGTLDIEVRQIGTHGTSAAARLNVH
jgi:hypothetical protein